MTWGYEWHIHHILFKVPLQKALISDYICIQLWDTNSVCYISRIIAVCFWKRINSFLWSWSRDIEWAITSGSSITFHLVFMMSIDSVSFAKWIIKALLDQMICHVSKGCNLCWAPLAQIRVEPLDLMSEQSKREKKSVRSSCFSGGST